MVECPNSVRSGPQIPVRWGKGAGRIAERCAVAAVIALLTAGLLNVRAQSQAEAARAAKLRRLVWQAQDHVARQAQAFHHDRVYARVLEERLARYEPGQRDTWRHAAILRAERETHAAAD